MFDAHGPYNYSNLHTPAAVTATGEGTAIDALHYDGIGAVVVNSAAGSGTDPTLDISLEHSDDNSTFVAASGAVTFDQITDAAASFQTSKVDLAALKRYVRVKHTVGGTTPSFTYSAAIVGISKA